MSLGTFLIIVLVLILVGVIPGRPGPYSPSGFAPLGIVGVILVVVLVLWLMGRL